MLSTTVPDDLERPRINANRLTLLSFPIKCYDENAHGWGSAFLLRVDGRDHIVTAWHNLSGRDFITKQAIANKHHQSECLPKWANLKLPLIEEIGDDGEFSPGFLSFRLNLYVNDAPVWRVDREHGSRFDVAVIPIEELSRQGYIDDPVDCRQMEEIIEKLNGWNEYATVSFSDRRLQLMSARRPDFVNRLAVAQDVFVLGFPIALAVSNGYAMWKRGSIAYEPEFNIGTRPCMLIDTATRKGLSGAPVIGNFVNPSFQLERGVLSRLGTELGFIGLYTARIGDDPDQAQLGLVWKLEALEHIVRCGGVGTSTFDFATLCREGKDESLLSSG